MRFELHAGARDIHLTALKDFLSPAGQCLQEFCPCWRACREPSGTPAAPSTTRPELNGLQWRIGLQAMSTQRLAVSVLAPKLSTAELPPASGAAAPSRAPATLSAAQRLYHCGSSAPRPSPCTRSCKASRREYQHRHVLPCPRRMRRVSSSPSTCPAARDIDHRHIESPALQHLFGPLPPLLTQSTVYRLCQP